MRELQGWNVMIMISENREEVVGGYCAVKGNPPNESESILEKNDIYGEGVSQGLYIRQDLDLPKSSQLFMIRPILNDMMRWFEIPMISRFTEGANCYDDSFPTLRKIAKAYFSDSFEKKILLEDIPEYLPRIYWEESSCGIRVPLSIKWAREGTTHQVQAVCEIMAEGVRGGSRPGTNRLVEEALAEYKLSASIDNEGVLIRRSKPRFYDEK
jgi:hypothetical protein